MRLTNGDVRWLAENLREMHIPPDDWSDTEPYYPDGPDAVMTSIGYVGLWADGSVSGYDVLDVDSVLSGHCPVCGALDTDDSTADHSNCDDEDTVYLERFGRYVMAFRDANGSLWTSAFPHPTITVVCPD